ncbi:Sel1 domain-containing protein repeat-containing protein [Capsaspora owczarzaki ATCC 30864]|uniref:TKL/IRAK protein kinase n=1 Tax=Capsaspora owczarzaki (strain ATCC 30864) TaxID=595528 RepID=A0A0D2X2Y3_CAPO3|nr:Sel1 domain-containing protein repeat-containing protein [Capsaspora owczarzaki ATCC 30864]KJE93359.1 TKL/IRAK protein kinase [Capsaspora owczarzaki ATCC 30864]|eukprot:XP_004347985.2 Sel1 domain-containing protein repeat-containing protein [Capsaspora owczarzaki ATCC 30864]
MGKENAAGVSSTSSSSSASAAAAAAAAAAPVSTAASPAFATTPAQLDDLRRRASASDAHPDSTSDAIEAQFQLGLALLQLAQPAVPPAAPPAQPSTSTSTSTPSSSSTAGKVMPDHPQALIWLRRAAERKHAGAALQLGLLHEYGAAGAPKSDQEAAAWYQRAQSMKQFGTVQHTSEAARRYASLCLVGRGVKQSVTDAIAWLRIAAEANNKFAQLDLALVLSRESPLVDRDGTKSNPRDELEASKWLHQAALNGLTDAQYMLAEFYFAGRGVKKDVPEALRRLKVAAARGHNPARVRLGALYDKGESGVLRDRAEAFKWYMQAAEAGDAVGEYAVAGFYKKGIHVALNDPESVKWLIRSAEHGCSDAQVALGSRYMDGKGVGQDRKAAVHWFRKSSEQLNRSGQFWMANIFANGRGLTKNDKEAFKYYKMAAEQGLAAAQYTLGHMYTKGRGVAASQAEANKWFRRAADQGNLHAKAALESTAAEEIEMVPQEDEDDELSQVAVSSQKFASRMGSAAVDSSAGGFPSSTSGGVSTGSGGAWSQGAGGSFDGDAAPGTEGAAATAAAAAAVAAAVEALSASGGAAVASSAIPSATPVPGVTFGHMEAVVQQLHASDLHAKQLAVQLDAANRLFAEFETRYRTLEVQIATVHQQLQAQTQQALQAENRALVAEQQLATLRPMYEEETTRRSQLEQAVTTLMQQIQHQQQQQQQQQQQANSPHATTGASSQQQRVVPVEFPFEMLSNATSGFAPEQKLGQGSFGEVYRGAIQNKRVAVKRLVDMTRSFEALQADLTLAAKLRHANLVLFVGFARPAVPTPNCTLCIVYEPVINGSLRDRLDRTSLDFPALSWELRRSVALGVANGMYFLQSALPSEPVFHLGLKSTNVLLDASFVPKISDTGFARTPSHQLSPFMCPEYNQTGYVSTRTDVYSFGILLLELVTGKVTVDQTQRDSAKLCWRRQRSSLEALVDAQITTAPGWGPERLTDVNELAALAMQCVEDFHADRPTFAAAIARLGGGTVPERYPATGDTECVVCFQNPISRKVLPCMHAAYCARCADVNMLKACRVCHTRVEHVAPVSF